MRPIIQKIADGVKAEIPDVQVEEFHYGRILGLCHEVGGKKRAVEVGRLVHDEEGNIIDVVYPGENEVPDVVERLVAKLSGETISGENEREAK